MHNPIIEIVKSRIVERHQGDEKQLEVIFSPSSRILVEAPAGYGKTNTMVSKIAFMMVTKQIPNPKKLLALTFSVNAAYKIKKDVTQQVPLLLAETGLNINPSDKIYVSNYHGFCRGVLKKYGFLFHSNLKSIGTLQSIDDSSPQFTQSLITNLLLEEALFTSQFSTALRNSNSAFLNENINTYCNIIIEKFLPIGFISYNAILALTLKLFKEFPNVLKFYTTYFSTILVDEYQDTNILSYEIIKCLITPSSKVILLGDTLQRIYGFIGAVPNLLSISEIEFILTKIELSKNYRFASNPEMLKLDNNIRRNAENSTNPIIIDKAKIDFTLADNQNLEALEIVKKSLKLIKKNPTSKVAILVKQRGKNVDLIINTFEHNKIPFFYGLFTDEDSEYISFHHKALFEFIELIKVKQTIFKKLANEHILKLKDLYKDVESPLINALTILLQIFWDKIFSDFSFLENDEKINLIKDTFAHNSLKQYIEFIDSHIIISTVHAAKGLEWDFVIISDMEQDSFPNWFGLCDNCKFKNSCNIIVSDENEKRFLEELSVFYVAVTRARKQVFFTASKTAPDRFGNNRGKNISCFLKLPGITF